MEKVNVTELLGKVLGEGSKDEMRARLHEMLDHVMDTEVASQCGAEYGDRSAERVNSRDGYRTRLFETRLGKMDLAIPKLRQGAYFPSFLDPRRRWE